MRRTYKKRTLARKPQCSEIDHLTQDILSNLVGNYVLRFGMTFKEQISNYKKEVGGLSLLTIIKVRRKKEVNNVTISKIFAHFNLVIDTDYLAATGIIRHVDTVVKPNTP